MGWLLNRGTAEHLSKLASLKHDGCNSCCVDVLVAIFHTHPIGVLLRAAGVFCLPESGGTNEMASAQNMLLHLSSRDCDLNGAQDCMLSHFEQHYITRSARIDTKGNATPTQRYSRSVPYCSVFLCYDLLEAACGQKRRHELASKGSALKCLTDANQTWLKPQESEHAEVVLRQ